MFFSDIFALLVTLVIFAVIAYVIISTHTAFNRGLQDTKENLKSKGLHISSSGISVKTDKTFDREAYLDATQRGFMSALNASSIHNAKNDDGKHGKRSTSAHHDHHHVFGSMRRSHSHQDEQDKKQRGVFWKSK
ncbi:hypothetical protein M378DRAFT_172974 [Amanita muscaria Koide BX008]|uniref:Uncharacterized protein n=1 Tax=Amanita muscaria (strain Koide BX008) TaxID=946122 RepID=A0A0C2SQ33_AMAMK|nr:hypothetical protein M378DRAFT_172974 [Amanita muscaria Koide BX008]